MTDPPNDDGEVPERFVALIDEILASDEFRTPDLPVSPVERPTTTRFPTRVVVYGAIAAAVVALALVGVSAIQDSDLPTVDTERAAIPTSPATSIPPGVAGDAARAQLAIDTEIAAGFGLTLGPQVFDDDGGFVLEDQPDLTPVYDRDVLVGYALRRDIDPGSESARITVYGPDGATVRGLFDEQAGFVAIDPTPEPGD